jgi:hypothetical protein
VRIDPLIRAGDCGQESGTSGNWRYQMEQQRELKDASTAGLREAAQICAFVSDLRSIDGIIAAEIAHREQEVGVFDLSDAAYPIAVRILRVRRANLANTIASLEGRLARLRPGSNEQSRRG